MRTQDSLLGFQEFLQGGLESLRFKIADRMLDRALLLVVLPQFAPRRRSPNGKRASADGQQPDFHTAEDGAKFLRTTMLNHLVRKLADRYVAAW